MKVPDKGQLRIHHNDDKMLLATAENVNVGLLYDGALLPTVGYDTGTVQWVNTSTTLLAASGVVSVCGANDPHGSQDVTPPSAPTLSAAGITSSFSLTAAFMGARVTTRQSGVTGTLHICFKRNN